VARVVEPLSNKHKTEFKTLVPPKKEGRRQLQMKKMAVRVAQVVERLPSKCEALSSTPVPKKTKQSKTYKFR
jgi:hypothetical protein